MVDDVDKRRTMRNQLRTVNNGDVEVVMVVMLVTLMKPFPLIITTVTVKNNVQETMTRVEATRALSVRTLNSSVAASMAVGTLVVWLLLPLASAALRKSPSPSSSFADFSSAQGCPLFASVLSRDLRRESACGKFPSEVFSCPVTSLFTGSPLSSSANWSLMSLFSCSLPALRRCSTGHLFGLLLCDEDRGTIRRLWRIFLLAARPRASVACVETVCFAYQSARKVSLLLLRLSAHSTIAATVSYWQILRS